MRIDAHQHYWIYDTSRHDWINDSMRVIQRNFLPTDLTPHLNHHMINGTVAVQVDQTLSENDFLIELASNNPTIKGIVGWVDFQSPLVEASLEKYTDVSIIKGFRHIVQGEPEGFLNKPGFVRGIACLKKTRFSYDILVYEHQLDDVLSFLKHFPDQPFVIDHIAKPAIHKGSFDNWKRLMQEMSRYPNVFCKLSGMVTEADWKNWKVDHFTPYLDFMLESFGPSRLMYGSDWPVCLVAATYDQQIGLVEQHIGKLSPAEKHKIMGANAASFYHL